MCESEHCVAVEREDGTRSVFFFFFMSFNIVHYVIENIMTTCFPRNIVLGM